MLQCCKLENNSYSNEQNNIIYLNKFYHRNSFLDKKLYLITELDGCGACLDFTIKFMKKNRLNSNMAFIVSGESKKKLNIILNKELTLSPNFIFDSTRIAMHKKLTGIHPKVYLCKDNMIVDIKDVTFLNADSVFNYVLQFVNN